MILTKEDLKEWFKRLEIEDKHRISAQKEKDKRFKDNMKALSKRAKELNEEPPMELVAVLYMDQPIGMSFYEKYKKWID